MTAKETSGIPGVDRALGGGLLSGDNVVWFGGGDDMHAALTKAYFASGPRSAPRVLVNTHRTPAAAAALVEGGEVLDARPGRRLADAAVLEQAVLARGTRGARIAFDDLDEFVRRLGAQRALALFTRVCPQLFDAEAICYWRAGEGSRTIRDRVRGVTQCVLEIGVDRLRIDKAEGRLDVEGRVYSYRLVGDGIEVEEERAIGRLAEGLRRLRASRGVSQSDVARLAGVSPSAVSQAEAGHRGLGLATVLAIAEGFGVGVDDLLGIPSRPGYVIARRDRSAARRGVTALIDDPSRGLRAYLVTLGAGERGDPPGDHKGSELVVVAEGLIQLDLGRETPVVRAGDAVLATTASVRSWRNLVPRPSRFFWILRDPTVSD